MTAGFWHWVWEHVVIEFIRDTVRDLVIKKAWSFLTENYYYFGGFELPIGVWLLFAAAVMAILIEWIINREGEAS